MKRLLTYLFLVLGLGLTFSVNVSANHSWNEGHFCIKKKGDDGKMQLNKVERPNANPELVRIAESSIEDLENEIIEERKQMNK